LLGNLHDPNAPPRVITARGDLAEDEKSTIALFKSASAGVVHVTRSEHGRDRFTLEPARHPAIDRARESCGTSEDTSSPTCT
jgi:hypothetical protein